MHHFSHPHHLLQEAYIDEEFLCDGCHAYGHGKAYRCTLCASSFQLHHRCATCPSSITLELHANHPLTLVNQIADNYNCTLCGDEVTGLYYTCEGCDFHAHPLCTELPARVNHTLHPNHVLTLRPASGIGQCMACGDTCSEELWRYQCEQCNNFDVHIECAFIQAPPPPPPEQAKTVQKSLSAPIQGQYPPIVYPPPPPAEPAKTIQKSLSAPILGQYPPPSDTWYQNQQPQQPPMVYPPPPPPLPAQINQKSPPTPTAYFPGQYPPSPATWYHFQPPQQPPIMYPPPPPPPLQQLAQANHMSPPSPATYFQGQYPPSLAMWYHYQQPQQPRIGWYPPPPPSQVNHWVNGYYYHANPHYYNNIPQYRPIMMQQQQQQQQHGQGQSSSPPKKKRRRIYSVLSAAASVAMTTISIGGSLFLF